MVPSLTSAVGLDDSAGYKGIVEGPGGGAAVGPSSTQGPTPGVVHGMPDPERLLRLAQEAESQSVTFFNAGVRASWARSFKAFRNQHMEGSKYGSPEYRGRSKYFRPKTRIAVLRKMASVAQSLFGTGDVVAVSAQNDADQYQVAAAALKQEILNYRLGRVSRRNGIRWFLTAMGAVQTSLLTGICISKQTWLYREDDQRAAGEMMGKPAVLEDRPAIQLIAPENLLFDANSDWTNPAQSSQYAIIRYPMSVDECRNLIEQNIGAGKITFRDVPYDQIKARARSSSPIDTTAARAAREGGRDPLNQASGSFSRVWVNEVFMRVGNLDLVYWTIDNQILLSDPIPVRQAYPAFTGERPIVIGYGSLEAFRPYPMAPVESWQQMQMETNDQANLRLDHMKQVVAPKAKVLRGNKVDLTQVQRAGPHGIVMVNKPEDVEWWQPPDLPQSAFLENNNLTADFDSLAGVFDAGSVSTNRQMNETVGGMKLLANAVNPTAAFDLSIWVETWAVPVLWQVMKLEEYYENDATLLAIAGQKAKLWERFGIDQITDELLTRETNVTMKIGVGANNLPEERIRQFANAWAVTSQVLMPFVQGGLMTPPMPKVREIVETIFGAAGFQDGGDRFFANLEEAGGAPPPPPPNPIMMAEQQNKADQIKVQREKIEADLHKTAIDVERKKEEALLKIEAQHQKSMAEIAKALLDAKHQTEHQAREHTHDELRSVIDHINGLHRDSMGAHNKAMSGIAMAAAKPQPAAKGEEAPAAAGPQEVAPEKPDSAAEEARLKLAMLMQQMQHAQERHGAEMAVAKRKAGPLKFVRGEDGRIAGIE